METLFDTAVDASSENLAIAKHFVSRLDAEGGTEMLPALEAALKDATPDDTTRLRQVVFLTDGSVGNEAQLFEEIANHRGRSRLFTVGIGSAPNSYFMRRAAELGRGTFTEIGSEAQVLERMSALFAKLEKPVMMGLKAEWPARNQRRSLARSPPRSLCRRARRALGEASAPWAASFTSAGTFDGKPWTATLQARRCRRRRGRRQALGAQQDRLARSEGLYRLRTQARSTRRSRRSRSSIISCRARPA